MIQLLQIHHLSDHYIPVVRLHLLKDCRPRCVLHDAHALRHGRPVGQLLLDPLPPQARRGCPRIT